MAHALRVQPEPGTYGHFHFTSSPTPLYSIKQMSIQTQARWVFGTRVHPLLRPLAFQVKSLFLPRHLVSGLIGLSCGELDEAGLGDRTRSEAGCEGTGWGQEEGDTEGRPGLCRRLAGPSPLPAAQGPSSRRRSHRIAHGLLNTLSFLRGILSEAGRLLILRAVLMPWTLGLLRSDPGDEPHSR